MDIAILVAVLLVSVTVHEFAHARVALREGDPTAERAGRVTLNPIPHLDPIGSILLPALLIFTRAGFLIGWAKPVPVDPANLRHGRWSDLRVSVAGVIANILLALACTLIITVTVYAERAWPDATWLDPIQAVATTGIRINFLLAVFNLLPVPPLDGWHVLTDLLPHRIGLQLRRFEGAGIAVFLLLFFTGALGTLLRPAAELENLSWTLIAWWT